ncbi:nuclear transport factor 2 family protein [Pseudohalocynthiibacter aestuariivivens]|nr:nuclear transport factor 2 family protein [Pseudohalocynthiibacter aestuariivivens]QIE46003.1 nuclear transport factor 2 family protein [Pseudohalocynthiibacter aestuariivivens]
MSDFAKIEAMMQAYFANLHDGDASKIDDLFLPECDLCCANEDGTYTHMSLSDYKSLVSQRQSPASNGYPVYGHIVSIDQSGPNTAFAKVDCAVQPKYFTDYLSLTKVDGSWKIAAKVYYVKRIES